jgi:hypothetical protein
MAAGLSEVSVLWTDAQGHRLRARFDKLLPAFILDPKSFGAHKRGRRPGPGAAHRRGALLRRAALPLRRGPREDDRVHPAGPRVSAAPPRSSKWLGRFPAADEERLAERMEFFPNGHPDQQSGVVLALAVHAEALRTPRGTRRCCCPSSGRGYDLTWRTGKQKVEAALQKFDYYVSRFGLGDQPNEDGLVAVPWATINATCGGPLDEEFPSWLGDVRMPPWPPSLTRKRPTMNDVTAGALVARDEEVPSLRAGAAIHPRDLREGDHGHGPVRTPGAGGRRDGQAAALCR